MGYNEDVVSAWGVCDVLHRIEENVLDVIYVEAYFNQVDAF